MTASPPSRRQPTLTDLGVTPQLAGRRTQGRLVDRPGPAADRGEPLSNDHRPPPGLRRQHHVCAAHPAHQLARRVGVDQPAASMSAFVERHAAAVHSRDQLAELVGGATDLEADAGQIPRLERLDRQVRLHDQRRALDETRPCSSDSLALLTSRNTDPFVFTP